MIKADLHTHTIASDGRLTVKELMKKAKEKDLDIIAITDHDTIDSIDKAIYLQDKFNIKVIPGIELTTRYNNESIHVLGYFKDFSNLDENFLQILNLIKDKRYKRGLKILEKLKQYFNIDLDFNKLLEESHGIIARPHIARAIQKKGYGRDFAEIFDLYLSNKSPAYVPNDTISLENALDILDKYNVIKVLAHPVLIKKTPIEVFMKFSFNGLEAKYPLNKEGEFEKILALCNKNNLFYTAGSDYHGIKGDKKHGDLGDCTLSGEPLKTFMKSLKV